MRPGRTGRAAAIAVAVALTGLMVAACGDSGESTGTAARATPVAAAAVEPTAVPRNAASATSPTARPAVQSAGAVERPAAGGGPGARPGGAGAFGGRFVGAGLADAVSAAVAEAAEKSVDEVQALQESGMTLAEIIKAEGVDRETVVDDAVAQILAGFQGGPAGRVGGARPGGAGAGGGGFGGGGFAGGGAAGGFDPRAALRNAVNARIDGEAPVAPSGARPFIGMGQAIINVVAERTRRDAAEVREARAGGQSFASLLFVAGQDVDAAIDEIVETIESNAAAAERPEGAPALPTGEALREAIEAIMYATDDSEAELTPPAAQGS